MSDDKALKQFLIWGLRRMSFRWPARGEVSKRARIERGLYKCESCGSEVKNKQFVIDHIEPVIDPKLGFTTWDRFIERLFCSPEGLQLICKICADSKTQVENALRVHYRKERKKLDNKKKK